MNRIPRLGASAQVRRCVLWGIPGRGFINDRLVSVCRQPYLDLIIMVIGRLAPNVVHASASTNGNFSSARHLKPIVRVREGR